MTRILYALLTVALHYPLEAPLFLLPFIPPSEAIEVITVE